MKKQLELEQIIEDGFRSHERRMCKYMAAHVSEYRINAEFITPSMEDDSAVFARIAFAILSANAPFEQSVKALEFCLDRVDNELEIEGKALARFVMVPAKGRFVTEAWEKIRGNLGYNLDGRWYRYIVGRVDGESWSAYRYRMQRMFKGLGIAKASFAVSLLYPLHAQVACIDTWMQKVFLRRSSFKQLGRAEYERIEKRIAMYGREFDCSTFLAQWMIWDHARGGTFNRHTIFPGSHKGSEAT